MNSPDFVSIIIVNYDMSDFINRLLESAKDISQPHEIIIVDNPSSPEATDWQKIRLTEYARIVRNSDNLGYGHGCNAGAAAANPDTNFICILNPDTVVPPGMLEAWVKNHRHFLPQGGILAPRLLNDNGTIQQSTYKFLSPIRYWQNHSIFSGFLKEAKKGNLLGGKGVSEAKEIDVKAASNDTAKGLQEPVLIDWAMGSAYLIDKSTWDKLEGFNPKFFQYAEDQDLCWRCRNIGLPVFVTDSVALYHSQGDPEPQFRKRAIIRLFDSLKRFSDINYGFFKRLGIKLSILADMTLRLLILLPFWPVKKNGVLYRGRVEGYISVIKIWIQPTNPNPAFKNRFESAK